MQVYQKIPIPQGRDMFLFIHTFQDRMNRCDMRGPDPEYSQSEATILAHESEAPLVLLLQTSASGTPWHVNKR